MYFSDAQLYQHSLNAHTYIMPHAHYHDAHELYYLVKGSTAYYIDDRIYFVKAGDFIFIPKGLLHKTDYETKENCERIVLNFSDKIFTNELWDIRTELLNCRLIHVPQEKLPYLEELLHKIGYEAEHEAPYNSLLINIYITELLVQLCRHKDHSKLTLSNTDQFYYAVSKYIRHHFQESLTLTELSLEFSMSKSHLSRKFKENTGIGINEYITYVRIANAEKLLLESNLSVTEIAQRCGFNDTNYFSTVFKKTKGISPQKVKKLR